MDINDFKHNFRYKLFLPFVYILNWALMFIGPTFIQVTYQKICLIAITYLCLKSTLMVTIAMIAAYKSFKMLGRAEKLKRSYLLRMSSRRISCMPSSYPAIRKMWSCCRILWTISQLILGPRQEYWSLWQWRPMRINLTSKRNNLSKNIRQIQIDGLLITSWGISSRKGRVVCWTSGGEFFKTYGINPDSVFLTIIDADSWVPAIYIKEMEDHMTKEQNYDRRHKFIYCNNQIYTRNHLDVPIITRTYDHLHSCMHHSNMLSLFDACSPFPTTPSASS